LQAHLRRLAQTALAKPAILLLGQSDAGKSRLINALLGAEWLTASWTPTTTVPVYIKHTRERPDWMGQDESWIFGGEWDPSRWLDREYAHSRKLAGGSRQVLYQWGTRQGGRGLGMAGAAILFAESDLLLSCDLVDLPGIGAPDRPEEEARARGALRWADCILYLSPANSFMKASDLAFLAEALRVMDRLPDLEPWANLFVIATQAGGVEGGNRETLARILDLGAGRLAHVLTATAGPDPSVSQSGLAAELRPHFFTYALERPDLRADFEAALPPLVAALPKAVARRADGLLPAFRQEALADLRREKARLTTSLNLREAYQWARPERRRSAAKAIRTALGAAATESRHRFLEAAAAELEPNAICSLIEAQRLSPTEATETLPALLGLRLQERAEALLRQAITDLFPALDEWANALPPASVGFNAHQMLGEALAEVPALGALALWGAQRQHSTATFQLSRPESLLQALRPVSSTTGWAGRLGGLVARLVGGSDWTAKLAQQVATQAAEAETAERFAQAVLDSAWAETEAGFAALNLSLEEAVAAWSVTLEAPPEQADLKAQLEALAPIESWLQTFE
jgi:hypothetical protein